MHPKYGLLFPDRFIFVLEETGLILPIGKWVLREACSQLVQWQKELDDIKDLHINVNLSAKQFQEPNLIVNIKNIIMETGIDPDCLILEITENIIMETGESTIETLMKLRDMNIKLAVDDFGTGYSSLSYLHRFPLSILKIDYTFIRQMNENSENIEIVKTIVNLAHNLGMDVVSEGVETEDQLEILKSLKCENGQGFLFSEPVDSIKAKLLIEENMMLLKM